MRRLGNVFSVHKMRPTSWQPSSMRSVSLRASSANLVEE